MNINKAYSILFLSFCFVNLTKADIFSDAEGGWYRSVKRKIDSGVSVETADNNGNTLLHKAAGAGQLKVTQLLIERGAQINKLNFFMETPLYAAVAADDYDMVALLLEQGADISFPIINDDGYTLLHMAVAHGNLRLVQLLVEYKAPLNKTDSKGQTALILALTSERLEIAKLLINAGADVNIADKESLMPLIIAIIADWHDIVEDLITHGADINDEKNNPIFWAVYFNRVKMIQLLLKNGVKTNFCHDGENANALHFAAIFGHEQIVEILLNAGVPVDCLTQENGTALIAAVNLGNIRIAKILLEHGANMFFTCQSGKTLYDLVQESKDKKMIALFEEYKQKQALP